MILKRVFRGAVIVFFIFTLTASPSDSAPNRIAWHSYEQGIAKAKQEAKKVYLLFERDRCGACKKMRAETFQDPAVINYLNDHFIAVSVNTVQQRNIADRYYIIGVPTSWFISDDGYSIQIPPGFYPADELLRWLKYIQTDSYKTMSFGTFKKGIK